MNDQLCKVSKRNRLEEERIQTEKKKKEEFKNYILIERWKYIRCRDPDLVRCKNCGRDIHNMNLTVELYKLKRALRLWKKKHIGVKVALKDDVYCCSCYKEVKKNEQ